MEEEKDPRDHTFSVNISAGDIFDRIVNAVNAELDEFFEGPAPLDAHKLTAVVISELGAFGLLDGSHFQMVKVARKSLGEK